MKTEAKHTPGPWHVNSRLEVGPISKEDDQTFGMVLPVADVYGDNKEADASLMAAAPQMYEALEAVLRVADRATVEFDMARAALSAATGVPSND